MRTVEQILQKPGSEALDVVFRHLEPWREFLRVHSGSRELETLRQLESDAGQQNGTKDRPESAPLGVIISAFVLTELKEAFAMAFVLLLPFLVIDLIVANVLAGLGMFMVSPATISLPLKLILFVLSDGWLLLAKALVSSYGG